MSSQIPTVEIPTQEKIQDPEVIAKLGKTYLPDASKRHSIQYFRERIQKGYKEQYWGLPLQIGYVIRTAWSGYFTEQEAYIIESLWEVFVQSNLDIGKVFNGYTECRYIPAPQLERFKTMLTEKFPKSRYPYKEGLTKVYLVVGYKRKQNLTMESQVTVNQ